MTKTDLLTLADKCEAADASEQRELLEAAWKVIHGGTPADIRYLYACGLRFDQPTVDLSDRFDTMLDADAYESAALMLVPTDCCVSAMGEVPDDLCCYVNLWREGEQDGEAECRAGTLALAITAAALRAQAEECE